LFFLWALLLTLANIAAWCLNTLSLPGNWLIVGLSALFAALVPSPQGQGIGWTGVAILAVLAVLGEVVEFFASAAVAGKRGGSRRGMVLAVGGTTIGSIAGAFISLPIPIIGPLLGALVGGALGAFGGAWVGEAWKGKSLGEGYHISKGALWGRLLGTAGKLAIGTLMVVIAAIDTWF